jgi:non-canonical (house-cleaning) NTP pyrophosphatase
VVCGVVQVFGRTKSGQGNGTVGKLTANVVTRAAYYEHAVMMALIPFMKPDLYPEYGLVVEDC